MKSRADLLHNTAAVWILVCGPMHKLSSTVSTCIIPPSKWLLFLIIALSLGIAPLLLIILKGELCFLFFPSHCCTFTFVSSDLRAAVMSSQKVCFLSPWLGSAMCSRQFYWTSTIKGMNTSLHMKTCHSSPWQILSSVEWWLRYSSGSWLKHVA